MMDYNLSQYANTTSLYMPDGSFNYIYIFGACVLFFTLFVFIYITIDSNKKKNIDDDK